MDYRKIHDCLIDKARSRQKLDVYGEWHHIVPKSFGGDNSRENLVFLSAREHFIIHRLLAKLYPMSGMVHAVFKMACVSKFSLKYGRITSSVYASLREQHSKRMSSNVESNKKKGRPGRKQTEEHKHKRVESRKNNGPWLSEETKNKISESLTGHENKRKGTTLTKESEINGHLAGVETRKKNGSYVQKDSTKKKISEALKGKPKNREPLTEEQLLELREKKSRRISCIHCGKEGQCMVMYRWHFDNCKFKTIQDDNKEF